MIDCTSIYLGPYVGLLSFEWIQNIENPASTLSCNAPKLPTTGFLEALRLLGCNRVSVEGNRLLRDLPETLCWPPEL